LQKQTWSVLTSQVQDSYYKPLTPEQSVKAFQNEYDFDSPEAIDFDALLQSLKDLKAGYVASLVSLSEYASLTISSKKADIPIYSFEKHARLEKTNTIYSPHVLILEGIFALHDQRVLDMLDLKIFAEADPDLCLSRRRKTSERFFFFLHGLLYLKSLTKANLKFSEMLHIVAVTSKVA
jgi:uridine kinase